MATLVLSAAGAAVGGSIGGTVAGLSTAVVGRAVGATIGRVIDQSLMGEGTRAVETGRIDRFRLNNAGEGEAVGQVYGRMRVGGQVIWASDFAEAKTVTQSGGGKGTAAGPRTTTTSYSYSVNLAVALCEGVITRVGRVWADGEEVAIRDLNMRIYAGTDDQLPDPLMEAVEGTGQVPAYRGTAYVVFENLELGAFGNRVPQFSFEVARPEQPGAAPEDDLTRAVEAVALMPGTGEYALATTPVYYTSGPGSRWSANTNTPAARSDFSVSLEALGAELPNVGATSLVVSWFGNDLRCQHCQVQPKVERANKEGENMPWQVAGVTRSSAAEMPLVGDDPVYGGTPTDQSVIEAIQAMHAAGKDVVFYPFILMDQLAGNGLPDPYGAAEQPHLPWRGRITLDQAPGQAGSSDGTAAAVDEVAAFFGTVRATDFTVSMGEVTYSGPAEWSFSRFILHYAALCAAAGGVQGFCIGSELRGLTQIRGAGNTFPFVSHLQQLVADARALLGGSVMLGYAADWSEYFGYQPQDGSGDRFFHLDPLWADPEIDFIGIDNYMPLSDWRDGTDHLDAQAGTKAIYDLDYLRGNIEGGEGYDWYYADDADAQAQLRTPITDAAHAEPWIWRYKDIRNWWQNPHHDRIGGVRAATPSAWVPQSKPVWFTEYGCAAIDKGTNAPNRFLDPKSSESGLPPHSSGARDDLMQMQYLRAMTSFYADATNNPVSSVYSGPMVDMSRAFVWAWDARPYPFFPNNRGLWSDGNNYARGHWLTGRASGRPLSGVVQEICARAGLTDVDVSGLHGLVRGYGVRDVDTGRAALQPLMLRFGFDAVERDGRLCFRMRSGRDVVDLDPGAVARSPDLDGDLEYVRDPELELAGRVRLQFVEADGDYEMSSEEATLPDQAHHAVAASDMALALSRSEGRQVVERWLTETRVARERVRFALPPSAYSVGAGDVVSLPDAAGGAAVHYRVDRVDQGPHQIVEAVRIEGSVYLPAETEDDAPPVKPFVPPVPVTGLFLDLPLIRGDEAPHAPYVAASADPWPGSVAIYQSSLDADYALNSVLTARAGIGFAQTALGRAPHGLWQRGAGFEVEMLAGGLDSISETAVLSGGNLAAIGDGTPGNWELIQFTTAELVSPGRFRLDGLLRGQLGSDALMPASWPVGSWFVRLDGAPGQIDLSANLRNVSQHFRIGPARRGYDDPSYVHLTYAFAGNGLRPYAPAHLTGAQDEAGNLTLSWLRRSRIEGDSWEGEVPLGEETEAYVVQVLQGGTVLREVALDVPGWTYPASLQAQDGAIGAVELSVAQVSARFGPGLAARLDLTL